MKEGNKKGGKKGGRGKKGGERRVGRSGLLPPLISPPSRSVGGSQGLERSVFGNSGNSSNLSCPFVSGPKTPKIGFPKSIL